MNNNECKDDNITSEDILVASKLKIAIEYAIMSLILITKQNSITVTCTKRKDCQINFGWDVKSVENNDS